MLDRVWLPGVTFDIPKSAKHRPIFHPRCRYHWRQLYGMNHRTDADRARFLDRIGALLQRL